MKVRQDRKCKKSILVSDKGRREALGEETVELLKEEEQVAVLERSDEVETFVLKDAHIEKS